MLIYTGTFCIKNTSVVHKYKKLFKEFIKKLFSHLGKNTLRLTNNFYEVDLTVLLRAQDGFKYVFWSP